MTEQEHKIMQDEMQEGLKLVFENYLQAIRFEQLSLDKQRQTLRDASFWNDGRA